MGKSIVEPDGQKGILDSATTNGNLVSELHLLLDTSCRGYYWSADRCGPVRLSFTAASSSRNVLVATPGWLAGGTTEDRICMPNAEWRFKITQPKSGDVDAHEA